MLKMFLTFELHISQARHFHWVAFGARVVGYYSIHSIYTSQPDYNPRL
jgi:hypothetical protein